LSTTLGTFDDSKNARYTAGGKRILNWLIFYDGTTAYVNRWVTPESDNNTIIDLDTQPEEWITSSGTWTAVRSKYYTIEMVGRGAPGRASPAFTGGGAGAFGKIRIWINSGDVWTASMSTSEAGDTSFSDGTTTLLVKNANAAVGGAAPTGFDVAFSGGWGEVDASSPQYTLSTGLGSMSQYGAGGRGGINAFPNGVNANAYGAGGGGAVSGGTGGAGGSGAIHIIG
jgi:hypothetical protein